MRRVMVLGAPGSGKSRLARHLGRATGLPVFHLDKMYHRPGWAPPPPSVFEAEVAHVAALDAWIIDGNYTATAAARCNAADTIIHVDTPRWLAMVRVGRRTMLGLGRQRADAADGCRERLNGDFFRYVRDWQRDVAPGVKSLMDGFAGSVVVLRSRAETARFVRHHARPDDR